MADQQQPSEPCFQYLRMDCPFTGSMVIPSPTTNSPQALPDPPPYRQTPEQRPVAPLSDNLPESSLPYIKSEIDDENVRDTQLTQKTTMARSLSVAKGRRIASENSPFGYTHALF